MGGDLDTSEKRGHYQRGHKRHIQTRRFPDTVSDFTSTKHQRGHKRQLSAGTSEAVSRKLQLQNRISAPKPKRDNFEAPFERNFERKIVSANII